MYHPRTALFIQGRAQQLHKVLRQHKTAVHTAIPEQGTDLPLIPGPAAALRQVTAGPAATLHQVTADRATHPVTAVLVTRLHPIAGLQVPTPQDQAVHQAADRVLIQAVHHLVVPEAADHPEALLPIVPVLHHTVPVLHHKVPAAEDKLNCQLKYLIDYSLNCQEL